MRRFAPEGDWTRDTMAYASGHGSAGVLLHEEFVGKNCVIEGNAGIYIRTFHPLEDFYISFQKTNVGSGALDFSLRLSLGLMEIHGIH